MLANYINDLYATHCIRNKYDYRTHDLAGRFQTFWIYAAKMDSVGIEPTI